MKTLKKLKKISKVAGILGVGAIMIGASGCVSDADFNQATKDQYDIGFNAGENSVIIEDFPEDIAAIKAGVDITTDNQDAVKAYLDSRGIKYSVDKDGNMLAGELDTDTNPLLWSDEYFLGQEIVLDLDDYFVAKLVKGEATHDGDNYDFHEEIRSTGFIITTSETAKYKDFTDKPRGVLEDEKVLGLVGVFDKVVEDDVSREKPIDVKFLGKDLKITDVDAESGKVTLQTGGEYFMNSGDSVVTDGKTVKLVRVGSAGEIVVDVDGVQETIPAGQTETVNKIQVRNAEVFYDNNQASCAATLFVGDDIEETVEDGDAMVQYGEVDDNSDAEFVWGFKFIDGDLKEMASVYNQRRDSIDDDEEFPALSNGDRITFPEDYLAVVFADVSEPDSINYEFDIDGKYVEVKADEDFGFKCLEGDYKKIYVDGATIYDDTESIPENILTDCKLGYSDFTITVGDTTITVKNTNTNENFNRYELVLNHVLGAITYNGNSIATREKDLLTSDGLIVRNPEGNIDSNEAEIDVFKKPQEATIEIRNPKKE